MIDNLLKIHRKGIYEMDDMLTPSLEETLADINNDLDLDDTATENYVDSELDAASEQIAAEAALLDLASPSEIEELGASMEDMHDVSDIMGIAMERSVVRLDKAARMKHLRKANVLNLARKDNHAKYRKLLTVWKMERALEKDLDSIYRSRADTLARKQIQNYAANGIKKINKAYPNTAVGKGRVAGKVAVRAKNQADKFFNKPKTSVNANRTFSWT